MIVCLAVGSTLLGPVLVLLGIAMFILNRRKHRYLVVAGVGVLIFIIGFILGVLNVEDLFRWAMTS
jgi:hypothetical protein